jgi:hypothetical protein
MNCLQQAIENKPEEFLLLGVLLGDLGSHSAQKGESSYTSAGSAVCPPMVSICLHAMWSMGSIKEYYLQYEKSGDQHLGRIVSKLDVNDITFATSPPFLTLQTKMKEIQPSLFRRIIWWVGRIRT